VGDGPVEQPVGIAAVTGSASGIGAAVRRRLERDGDRVIGVDLRGAEVEADLATPAGRARAIAAVLECSGGTLDRMVACAGVGPHVADHPLIASVNYFGAVDVLDGLLPALRGRPGAAAVAVCSNSAQLGPFQEHPYVLALLEHDEPRARELLAGADGVVAYAGSKHALSRALRRRAPAWGAAGVRLNGVAPGPTETPMLQGTIDHPVFGKGLEALPIPLARWGTPEEIAGVIAFLLGRGASYVHGSILYVDGGCDAAVLPDRF
jgi:NAD(P)-dependent dehydrogenase (short-subunit alcohol dehydrogenase family)